MNHRKNIKLGTAIKQAREAKDISARELGRAIGTTHSYISKLEDGWFQSISPENLQALARALELDVRDLFTLAGYQVPEGLPTLPTYLRTRYGDQLDEAAIERMTAYFDFERSRHEADEEQQSGSRP